MPLFLLNEPHHEKSCLCHMRKTKAQISLCFFSSITTGTIEAKFHVEPLLDGGTKACSNGPGHMTKVAAMPINGIHH